MILFYRKNIDCRFVFLEGADSGNSTQTENKKPADKAEGAENPEQIDKTKPDKPVDTSEAADKERQALLIRHAATAGRIENAKTKYERCIALTKKLPEGTDVRTTAENACATARDTLAKIDRTFPKLSDLTSGAKPAPAAEPTAGNKANSKPEPTDSEKFAKALNRSSTQAGTVIRELSATEKEAIVAKQATESLKGLGVDEKTIQTLFQETPIEGIKSIVIDLKELKINGKQDFSKIAASINQDVNKFLGNLNTLKALPLTPKLSSPQMAFALVRIAGGMEVGKITKYLQTAQETKVGVDFALKFIGMVDMNKDMASQLVRIQYFDTLAGKFGGSKDKIIALFEAGMEDEDLAKYLSAAEANKMEVDSALSIIDKIDFTKEVSPQLEKIQYGNKLTEEFKRLGYDFNNTIIESLYIREHNVDTVLTFFKSVDDLTQNLGEKIALFHSEQDPIKARELFIKRKAEADKEGTDLKTELETKELEGYKGKYPMLKDSYEPLELGRLIESKPGLYAFIALELRKFGNANPNIDQYREFSNDPSLPLAYKIYEKGGGKPTGNINLYTPIEQALCLARTLHLRGTKPEDVDQLDLKQEFDNLNNLASYKSETGKMELYKYTDENGAVHDRQVIVVAGNQTNAENGALDAALQPAFGEIKAGLMDSGAAEGNILLNRAKINDPLLYRDDQVNVNARNPEHPSYNPNYEKLYGEAMKARRIELAALKAQILEKIKTAEPPMTMCFTGHGSGNGLALAASDPASDISARDLAAAIKVRSEKFKGNPNLSKDIYLLAACATQQVAHDLFRMIKEDGSVAPIVGGAAERGISVKIDNGFKDDTFQLEKGRSAKIRDFLATDHGGTIGENNRSKDMYLYVPDAQGRPTQIK